MNSQVSSTPEPFRLLGSRRSPYVRKVLITIMELGFEDRLEFIELTVNSRSVEFDPANPNPLGQIPTLVTASGEAIYDSPVICAWLALEAGAAGERLTRGARGCIETTGRASLAQSMIDLQLRLFSEDRRKDLAGESGYAAGHRARIAKGLDAFEADRHGWMSAEFDLGQVATVAMLSYLDFRHETIVWRDRRPQLAAWYEGIRNRASLRATEYRG